jgi:hypothetical protein
MTSPTQLSVQCSVAVANGSANFSSLIAIPTAWGSFVLPRPTAWTVTPATRSDPGSGYGRM